jgi:RNA recognition motif-containing protein
MALCHLDSARIRDLKKMFVGNLPPSASEETVRALFAQFGTVRSIRLAADVFTGQCRGFGFIEMEGHEARAAVAALDGKTFDGKSLRVRFDDPRNPRGRRRR